MAIISKSLLVYTVIGYPFMQPDRSLNNLNFKIHMQDVFGSIQDSTVTFQGHDYRFEILITDDYVWGTIGRIEDIGSSSMTRLLGDERQPIDNADYKLEQYTFFLLKYDSRNMVMLNNQKLKNADELLKYIFEQEPFGVKNIIEFVRLCVPNIKEHISKLRSYSSIVMGVPYNEGAAYQSLYFSEFEGLAEKVEINLKLIESKSKQASKVIAQHLDEVGKYNKLQIEGESEDGHREIIDAIKNYITDRVKIDIDLESDSEIIRDQLLKECLAFSTQSYD